MVNTKNISFPVKGQNDSVTMKLNEADFVISVQSPPSAGKLCRIFSYLNSSPGLEKCWGFVET